MSTRHPWMLLIWEIDLWEKVCCHDQMISLWLSWDPVCLWAEAMVLSLHMRHVSDSSSLRAPRLFSSVAYLVCSPQIEIRGYAQRVSWLR